jgi:DNA-binding beta-propeller fold protein YncE
MILFKKTIRKIALIPPTLFSLMAKGEKSSIKVPLPEGEGFRVRAVHIITIITLFAAITLAQAQRLYEIPAPFTDTPYTSGTMTLTRLGRIISTNPFVNRLTVIGLDRTIEAAFDIGNNPRGVSITPDNLRVLAVSEGKLTVIALEDNTIAATYRIGGEPYAVVADDETAYVSLRDSNEVVAVNLATGRVSARFPTPDSPAALALWGDFLYVTHLWTGELSLIYLPVGEVVRTIQPHPQATLALSIEIDPINGRAFLPMSIANTDGRLANRIIPMLYIVDLENMQIVESINLVTADRPVNIPSAVAQPSNRSRLYIAYAGSNDVTVLNLDTGTADNHFDAGANPRAFRFNGDFTRIYVQDAVDGTISQFDTNFFALEDQIPAHTEVLDGQMQIGARLFNTAIDPRMSANRLLSCASCHYDGLSDGRTWGIVATPLLAEMESFDAEAINTHIQTVQGGTGLSIEGVDMTALIHYLQSLD